MINWTSIKHPSQIDEIIELSRQKTCLIYKHSPTCPISSMARHRLEGNWDFDDADIATYVVDVIYARPLSQQLAQTFGIRHESPQVLVIRDGQCIHHSSHLDISVGDLKGVVESPLQ